MSERTSPEDALELISWHLNYRQGETLSLNEVAESTGLSWATVHKYVNALETLQNLAPRITTDADGVHIGSRTAPMNELFSEGASALAVYLLVHTQSEEDATQPLALEDHASTLEKYSLLLDKMETLGWIERDEDTIRLTPTGVQIAGPTYSEVRNATPTEGDLRRYRQRDEIRAVLSEETANLERIFLLKSSSTEDRSDWATYLQESFKTSFGEWKDLTESKGESAGSEKAQPEGELRSTTKAAKPAATT